MESSPENSMEYSSHTGMESPQLRSRFSTLRQGSLREKIEDGFVVLDTPENEIEEKKLEQNYMFGFKKWKAHVTQRPFEKRSEAVKSLYVTRLHSFPIGATILPGNIVYSVLIGWWVALIYILLAALMAVSFIGWPYAKFCWRMAWYFLWPFGKFVKELTNYELEQAVVQRDATENETANIIQEESSSQIHEDNSGDQHERPLVTTESSTSSIPQYLTKVTQENIWRRPGTYVWLLIGCPVLFSVHSLVIIITGLLIIFIPISKIYLISLKKLLLMPPEKMSISRNFTSQEGQSVPSEVVLCVYQAVNIYFYKFTVDGMSIIVTNMLVFVVLTLGCGYIDPNDKYVKPLTKFIFGVLSIIPLAHYIGFAITSISSQSRHIVGAFLNALFGSFIELFIYVSSLLKQKNPKNTACYPEIVKSALTGSLLATMLLIPGLCMVVGGIKHKEQAVNVRSASVSSTLLFISVAGIFTPTIFAFTYGGYTCSSCYLKPINDTFLTSYVCKQCRYTLTMPDHSNFYDERVRPIVLCIAILLPLAYVVGLLYTLFTHAQVLEDHFKEKEIHDGLQQSGNSSRLSGHPKPVVVWGRLKSVIILIVGTVAMAFSAEVVVNSLEHILQSKDSKITETFIGVTVIAVVPEIPEIINGVQFALKNNINLSLEIGSSIAVQVCLLQIPVLITLDLIMDLGFRLLFNDLHLWAVILSVIIMNYTFVDGKSDYFQGSMLCIVYVILLVMFFYAPEVTNCEM